MTDDDRTCNVCDRALADDEPLRLCRACSRFYCPDCSSDHHEMCAECATENP